MPFGDLPFDAELSDVSEVQVLPDIDADSEDATDPGGNIVEMGETETPADRRISLPDDPTEDAALSEAFVVDAPENSRTEPIYEREFSPVAAVLEDDDDSEEAAVAAPKTAADPPVMFEAVQKKSGIPIAAFVAFGVVLLILVAIVVMNAV